MADDGELRTAAPGRYRRSTCASCALPLRPGQSVVTVRGLGTVHAYCADQIEEVD